MKKPHKRNIRPGRVEFASVTTTEVKVRLTDFQKGTEVVAAMDPSDFAQLSRGFLQKYSEAVEREHRWRLEILSVAKGQA